MFFLYNEYNGLKRKKNLNISKVIAFFWGGGDQINQVFGHHFEINSDPVFSIRKTNVDEKEITIRERGGEEKFVSFYHQLSSAFRVDAGRVGGEEEN